jgi:hypothetical protein
VSQAPDRRRRHLMDPNDLRPTQKQDMSLSSVQQWVLSVLVATTIMHLQMGIIVGAVALEDSERVGKIVLMVISAGFGMLAIGAALLIHKKSVLNPLLLIGFIPTLAGLWWLYLR